jgi:fumarylacetoacetase
MTHALDRTHDPSARSWVEGTDRHDDFPVQNLPLGVFSRLGQGPRIGVAIGDWILDVRGALADSAIAGVPAHALQAHLHADADCHLHLPAKIGDYTDFYVGIHHATHIGQLLRPDQLLRPNYKHVPIGYHGRASSVCVSGADVQRPAGQRKRADADAPEFGPSERLDYELELGVWVSGENALGSAVPIEAAAERIAGLCRLNDWSARDLQAWEYQPLGPFLAKIFLTTVSPWVVTSEALAPFRIPQPARGPADRKPLPYLWNATDQAEGAFAIECEAYLTSALMRARGIPPLLMSRVPANVMYWTVAQMITHHTVGGCNLMPGDLLGTGTLSGSDRHSLGSLMELSSNGRHPIVLPTGESRSFLQDGDQVRMIARAHAPGFRSIGFGCCEGTVTSSAQLRLI